jgi:hypothetical protein
MRTTSWLLALFGAAISLATPTPANAFDLEDYATTMRATRDAMLKAINEMRLAGGYYHIMLDQGRRYGIDVHEEQWLIPDSVASGSCETPPGFAFASNFTGPEHGHALANFIRQMGDILSPELWDLAVGNQEAMNSWFRHQRDQAMKAQVEIMLATWIPTVTPAESTCIDRVYFSDLEDLQTTLRAVRDAYIKAGNELALSIPPYKAAVAAYRAATDVYVQGVSCDFVPYIAHPRR